MRELENRLVKHIDLLVERYPSLESAKEDIIAAYLLMEECYENGGKLLVAGNGGSAADAEHIVGELMKGFKMSRKSNSAFSDKIPSKTQLKASEVLSIFAGVEEEIAQMRAINP